MAYKYKIVDTSTIHGIETAEKLKAQGWTIDRVGLFLVYFSRKVNQRKAA